MFANKTKQALSTAYKVSLRAGSVSFLNASRMGFLSKHTLVRKNIIGSTTVRCFAAKYPEHIALEMPNLSPTMEKVSGFADLIKIG
jgi:hypothetical protein